MSRTTLTNGIIIVAAVVTGIALAQKPLREFLEQKHQASLAQEDMRKSESKQLDLAAKKARLESPVGREEQARADGFQRPNEVPIPTE